ncbi:MAG: hypothetical protein RO257_00545 [Candidatus Kapabacteria bacterium]|nr:hypothetical protein [Candidatus Kapabacteria bacterium]
MIATKQISVTVDEITANLFENADKKRKDGINYLLYEWLKDDNDNKDELSFLMNKIGISAIRNGLTEEKLNSILKNK